MREERRGGITDLICIKTPSVRCHSHHLGPMRGSWGETRMVKGGRWGERAWGMEGWEDEREESISRSVRRGSGKARPVMNHLTFGITMEWWSPKQLALWSVLIFLSSSQCVCVCVCVWVWVCVCVCVCVFAFESVSRFVQDEISDLCVCVCVCERERERARDKWESGRGRASVNDFLPSYV